VTEDYRKYLDPAVISRLKGMDIKARLVVEGFVSGLHRGPYKGFSVEFAEHRQYMPGDPIRYLDWKVYGKTDRFYIKEYEEETNLRAYLIMDGSGSMGYSSDGMTKLEYGSYLAASLAYLMLKQQDSVGLLVFDTKLFRHRKHEVIVFHVLDPFEVSFPFEHEVILKDMETGEEIPAVPWEVRKEYREKVAAWINRYRTVLRQSGIDYVPVRTSTTFDVALFSYLEKRQRLG
jgi:uncharacterized protein (DUF58 family)